MDGWTDGQTEGWTDRQRDDGQEVREVCGGKVPDVDSFTEKRKSFSGPKEGAIIATALARAGETTSNQLYIKYYISSTKK